MAERSHAANTGGATAIYARRHRHSDEVRPRALKLYESIRSAHLERARDDMRTTILYVSHRYDFDRALAAELDIRRAGMFATWWYAVRNEVDVIEVNEPLIASAAARSLAAVLGNRQRAAVTRRGRARVVTYAIENKDPRETLPHLPVKARIRWQIQSRLIVPVWRRLDRVAFGTEAAQELYAGWFARIRHAPRSQLVPALPSRATTVAMTAVAREPIVLFLGELSPRKGFPLLVEAWPIIAEHHPSAALRIVGKGVGEGAARELAGIDPRVRVHIDPPRAQIHRLLTEAKVLALPSQPTPLWREQVGLPIVEALGAGCEIVTTTQTGIAGWLRAHGHLVLDHEASAKEVAAAVGAALEAERTPDDIAADLPLVDGRRAAENWLYSSDGGGDQPSGLRGGDA